MKHIAANPCTACEYYTRGCPKTLRPPQYFATYNSTMRTTGSCFSQQAYYNIALSGPGKRESASSAESVNGFAHSTVQSVNTWVR